MLQCWRKSKMLGGKPGPVPHCPHWASHEISNKWLWYNKTKNQCV